MSESSPAIVAVVLRVERELDARPAEVFRAYADVNHRAAWFGSRSFDHQNFRVGRTDRFSCGDGDPGASGTIGYEHIVENERIVYVERLLGERGDLVAVSLVGWAIDPAGDGCVLSISDQTTSVVGSRPIEGRQRVYELMVDRLSAHLTGHSLIA